MQDFFALLSRAAEHATKRRLENNGMSCRIELHRVGFQILADYTKRDLHSQRIVPFESVFAANFPVLEAEIDRVIADLRIFAARRPLDAA